MNNYYYYNSFLISYQFIIHSSPSLIQICIFVYSLLDYMVGYCPQIRKTRTKHSLLLLLICSLLEYYGFCLYLFKFSNNINLDKKGPYYNGYYVSFVWIVALKSFNIIRTNFLKPVII